MGGRGSSGSRNTSEKFYAGKLVSDLDKYNGLEGSAKIRKDFNLDYATDQQIWAIRQIFKGMQQYDTGYDENRTPFVIEKLEIRKVIEQTPEELAQNKELFGRTREVKDIQVSIRTSPSVDNDYIKTIDTKYRSVLIGPRGSYYTYNDKGKRVKVSDFDIAYGKRY